MASGWRRPRRQPGRDSIRLTTVARLTETKGRSTWSRPSRWYELCTWPPSSRCTAVVPARRLAGALCQAWPRRRADFVGAFTSRTELSRSMADTDVFAMSSILEGQPLGLVEAMAYQCPIVTTAVGGIPKLIQDGVNGLLCAPRDTQGLAHKLIALIEDEPFRSRLGLAARRTYEGSPFQPASVCSTPRLGLRTRPRNLRTGIRAMNTSAPEVDPSLRSSRNLRIAICVQALEPLRRMLDEGVATDGTYVVQGYVAEGLKSRGHRLTFLAPTDSGDVECADGSGSPRTVARTWSTRLWFRLASAASWRLQQWLGVPYLNVFSNYRILDACLRCLPGHDLAYRAECALSRRRGASLSPAESACT